MHQLIQKVEAKYRKPGVVDVRSGDTVRVHQKVKEGNKERVQVFEGVVIRTDRKNSLTSSITVRRISSDVGVEKTYLLHSPLVVKVEIVKRSKVRRKYLSFLRERSGKSARLTSIKFNKEEANKIVENSPEPEVIEEAKKEEPAQEAKAEEKTEEKTTEEK